MRGRNLVVELLRGPMLLAVAGSVANGLNLVMNLVLARVLDEHGYGAVVMQTNIYLVLAVVGTAVLTAVVHRDLAPTQATGPARTAWIEQLRRASWYLALVAALLAAALCRPVATLLSYPHPVAIAEAGVAAGLWLAVCVERGLLQARGNYPGLARNMVFETVLRVSCIIAAACAGLGVDGAGLGLLVGAVTATAAARAAVARTPALPPAPAGAAPPAGAALTVREVAPIREVTPVGVGSAPVQLVAAPRRTRTALVADTSVALATLIPLALLQYVDVVIVGWRNPSGAGSYAAISTACKIPVFVGLAVANYLLAEAARQRREGRSASAALAMAIGIVVTPGLLLAAVGAVAGRPLLSLLFGPGLTGSADALGVLALATTCLSVTLLFANYLLGAGNRQIVWLLAGCTPLATVMVALADGRPMPTALALLVSQSVTAVLAGVLVAREHRALRAAAGPPADERLPPAQTLLAARGR
ncbi:membrane hypothetical protein [Frankia sp. AiPs1]|uniref:lipopolysaccharide biosynthesis protein n=1 Tax=Frankia sp. AiPa1 TaxID=573492 RepID=UPI00202B5BA7|nr:lipopolysaccharide biosynthesis protein [Frankia sp. AiPa1]MCL9759691.1 lipopolysaccharide biosynthesis protein [Frankia sp. AiPa1]